MEIHDSTSKTTQPWLADFSSRHAGGKVGLQVYGKAKRAAARPLIVYFHGGLFNCGTVEDAAAIAAALSAEHVVACIDYPLAPRLQFPATVEAAFEALLWAATAAPSLGADARRLYIAGDQAGGNFAAVVAMMARDRGLHIDHAKLCGQILITPMLDPQLSTRSMQAEGAGSCHKAWKEYLTCVSNSMHPYASPTCSKRLGNLAPALVVSAERDPMRDEAEQYAAKLIAAGVPVQMRRLQAGNVPAVHPDHPEFAQLVQIVSQFVADGG
ncbi:MAG TPA: alpha/beta hydrolase [Methylophilaceae bacterium]|nr:alpha/beta hydrolase [Methylophilaceae bacterium]